MLTEIRRPSFWVTCCLLSAIVFAGTLLLQRAEGLIYPVLEDWEVTEVHVQGPDLYIRGTVRKVRDCDYILPALARSETGDYFFVESLSIMRGIPWPADGAVRKFGPWRIVNGAGHQFTIYRQDYCHPLWVTRTYLGTVTGQNAD